MMISKKADAVMAYFDELLPDAKCELNYTDAFTLLIAVMLSAQTTDKKVNEATAVLFKDFPNIDSLADAPLKKIEKDIHHLGLFHNKAENAKGIAVKLKEEYNYIVPSSREELMKFPGVGRKTANVVRCEYFKEAEFPVDTHIDRVSKRLGFASENDDVLKVELKLRKIFPKEKYILLHHQFIHFGRYHCLARNPLCDECKLKQYCKYFKNHLSK